MVYKNEMEKIRHDLDFYLNHVLEVVPESIEVLTENGHITVNVDGADNESEVLLLILETMNLLKGTNWKINEILGTINPVKIIIRRRL